MLSWAWANAWFCMCRKIALSWFVRTRSLRKVVMMVGRMGRMGKVGIRRREIKMVMGSKRLLFELRCD